jgi:O-acetylhomoserine/O-acetylserine sulfhydrylase-like pyridoxal-dependent enzyme
MRYSTSPKLAITLCLAQVFTVEPTTCSTTHLPKFGIEVTFVEDPSDPESLARKLSSQIPKAFFGETIANPKNEILDIKTVADIAHEVGVPLIVDNTVATPYLIKPIDFGADVVIHSATKFLSGHGNAVVGAIVDAGKFDYAQYPEKFKGFNEPDPSLQWHCVLPSFGSWISIWCKPFLYLQDSLTTAS